jgi:hypothetical protein
MIKIGHDHIEIKYILYSLFTSLFVPNTTSLFIIVLELCKNEDSRNNQENRQDGSNKSAEFYVWDIKRLFYNETNGFSLQERGKNSNHGTGAHAAYS